MIAHSTRLIRGADADLGFVVITSVDHDDFEESAGSHTDECVER